ncbi:MAG: MarR family transcriptional regulator [Actinomycetota bacterium]|nr:MarR family transcriptional regulator [Actinomycetota bacterium]
MPTDVMRIARTDAGLASALRVSVMRLSRRLRNERDASEDLTANQLAALGTLWRRGALTIGELASLEKVQPPSMTRTVDCLCAKGLVARAPHEQDRRQVVVTLTTAAEAVIQESRRRKEAWLTLRLKELSPDERQTLRDAAPILERLSQA